MNSMLNRIMLIAAIFIFGFSMYDGEAMIAPVLIAVTICGLFEYFDNRRFKIITFLIYTAVACFYPPLIIFIPVIIYDFIFTTAQAVMILSLLPIGINFSIFTRFQLMIIVLLIVASFQLKSWSIKTEEMKKNLYKQRDDMTEQSIIMQQKIAELTLKQDSECNLAALNERNRIAREIHDNVGHLLSSSIIQLGAIMAVTKEEFTKESLAVVKNTLDEGMNSIRKSVHNLNDESIDLYIVLKGIVSDFKFCEISFSYSYPNDPPSSIKYAVIAIVKEALSNVIKHSNATEVTVKLFEHPGLYQLVIQDNGKVFRTNPNGMGLENIRQRVDALKGIVNFDTSNGFKIFISFNKYILEG